jgi:hypothetical protein
LCSDIYIGYKVNVIKRQLLLNFDNAFAFTLYSRMFPPFTRYTPSTAFLNGGYNFSLRRFYRNSQLCHTLSFDAHWSSYLNSCWSDNKHK